MHEGHGAMDGTSMAAVLEFQQHAWWPYRYHVATLRMHQAVDARPWARAIELADSAHAMVRDLRLEVATSAILGTASGHQDVVAALVDTIGRALQDAVIGWTAAVDQFNQHVLALALDEEGDAVDASAPPPPPDLDPAVLHRHADTLAETLGHVLASVADARPESPLDAAAFDLGDAYLRERHLDA